MTKFYNTDLVTMLHESEDELEELNRRNHRIAGWHCQREVWWLLRTIKDQCPEVLG